MRAMAANCMEFLGSRREWMKSRGKQVFWVWVIYQAIKGTLTTAFIWVPLIWYMLEKQ